MSAHEDLPPHLRRLHDALKEEERAEREELEAWEQRPLAERVEAQVAFPPLSLLDARDRGRRVELQLKAPRGTWLHDGIDEGDAVWVESMGQRQPGRCVGHDGRVVDVLVREPVAEGAPVHVSLRADPSTWIRYRQGLERAATVDTALTRALLNGEVGEAVGEGAVLSGLDPTQQAAASHVLRATELALVHGPPGTGKTRLIGALLQCWVQRGERPYALADSNAATDNLVRVALARGLDVVRVGAGHRIAPDLATTSLDHRIHNGPFSRALTVLDRELSRCTDHRERRRLVAERRALMDQATVHAVESAQVVASTLGSLHRVVDRVQRGTVAVVDEATQATEPAIWGVVPFIDTLVLVGDPEQLGPFSRVPGSPLETSALQRLVYAEVPSPMLGVQYRMHQDIRALVHPVYGDAYTDHPGVAERRLSDHTGVTATDLTTTPLVWVDTAGAGFDEVRDVTTASLANPGEARVVALCVETLVQAGVARDDIAVIAPYSAQVALLDRMLAGIEVATVNAYQGRERRVVIVSWVRSNADGSLGFVADPRRLTVSLTRAQHLLVQVGDSATLCTHPRFAQVVDDIADAGALHSVFEPPWDAALG